MGKYVSIEGTGTKTVTDAELEIVSLLKKLDENKKYIFLRYEEIEKAAKTTKAEMFGKIRCSPSELKKMLHSICLKHPNIRLHIYELVLELMQDDPDDEMDTAFIKDIVNIIE